MCSTVIKRWGANASWSGFVAGVLAATLLGCGGVPAVVDEGPAAVSTPNAQVLTMVWSPDSARLVYVWLETPPDLSARVGLKAGIDTLDLASGSSRRLVADDCCDEQLQLTNDGKSLFYAHPADGALRLLRIPLDGNPSSGPERVADHIAKFAIAPDGHTVATGDWGSGPLMLLDNADGTSRPLGLGSPIAFSPDQSQLVVAVTTQDPEVVPAQTYFVVELATRDRRPITLPSSSGVEVVSWDAMGPRLIIQGLVLIDVTTGRQEPIGPGTSYAGLTDRTLPLVKPRLLTSSEVCLERRSDIAEKNYCATRQDTLWRIDLRSGDTDVVAQTAGPTPAALSPDNHRLAIFDDGAIHIKELP